MSKAAILLFVVVAIFTLSALNIAVALLHPDIVVGLSE